MFTELTEQWRIDDDWYQAFLCQCRVGDLTDEMYNFFLGFPTEHTGSWIPAQNASCTLSTNLRCIAPSKSTDEGRVIGEAVRPVSMLGL